MLPHIQNSQAGRNLYDAVHKNMFEVTFILPEALKAQFGADEAIITEHVLTVSGLDAVDKAPSTVTQKFMGTTRTFIAPSIDDTSAEISVSLSLNLRNGVDNYIYKLFKAWGRLGYDITTGERHMKKDYTAKFLKVQVGNQSGDVYREVVFKDVMMAEPISGMGEYDYTSSDPMQIDVKFKSDWFKDTDA